MVPGRVLIVGQDSTGGWRAAADAFAGSLRRAGVDVRVAGTGAPPKVRTFMLTDLAEALLARRAAQRAIGEHDPEAIVYFSVTASLLWPRAGAISLDSVAAENRPGRHGVWQRALERRRLEQAPLILVWSPAALAPIVTPHAPVLHVPPPIDPPPSSDRAPHRDIAAVTYAADPQKRRLGTVLDAWARARRPGETLVVTGLDGFEPPPEAGVTSTGRIPNEAFKALLARARTFVAAPRREDFGIAALEALAAGAQLVTTPAPGPYPAREIATRLDPRLVSADLPRAIRIALDDPRPGYELASARELAPYATAAVDEIVAGEVVPRLLAPSRVRR